MNETRKKYRPPILNRERFPEEFDAYHEHFVEGFQRRFYNDRWGYVRVIEELDPYYVARWCRVKGFGRHKGHDWRFPWKESEQNRLLEKHLGADNWDRYAEWPGSRAKPMRDFFWFGLYAGRAERQGSPVPASGRELPERSRWWGSDPPSPPDGPVRRSEQEPDAHGQAGGPELVVHRERVSPPGVVQGLPADGRGWNFGRKGTQDWVKPPLRGSGTRSLRAEPGGPSPREGTGQVGSDRIGSVTGQPRR
jgi:hypothetical protein